LVGTGVADGARAGAGFEVGVAVGLAPQPAAPSMARAARLRRNERLETHDMNVLHGKRDRSAYRARVQQDCR
jgi:hypothetical protein